MTFKYCRIISTRFLLTLLFFFLITGNATYSADPQIWVVSKGAKLKADKSATSDTLMKLPIGTELNVISIEGKWYHIETSTGTQGWIYRGKVSETPPLESADEGGGLESLFGSTIEVSSADTSRSIRGLSPEVSEYAKNSNTPVKYQKLLDRLLKLEITDNEIESLLQEGGIGEYSQ